MVEKPQTNTFRTSPDLDLAHTARRSSSLSTSQPINSSLGQVTRALYGATHSPTAVRLQEIPHWVHLSHLKPFHPPFFFLPFFSTLLTLLHCTHPLPQVSASFRLPVSPLPPSLNKMNPTLHFPLLDPLNWYSWLVHLATAGQANTQTTKTLLRLSARHSVPQLESGLLLQSLFSPTQFLLSITIHTLPASLSINLASEYGGCPHWVFKVLWATCTIQWQVLGKPFIPPDSFIPLKSTLSKNISKTQGRTDGPLESEVYFTEENEPAPLTLGQPQLY